MAKRPEALNSTYLVLWQHQRYFIKENPACRQSKESACMYTSIRSFQWEWCLLRAKGRSETALWDLIMFFSSHVPKKLISNIQFCYSISTSCQWLIFSHQQLSRLQNFWGGSLNCLASTPTTFYKSFSKSILTNQFIPLNYHPSFHGFNAFCTSK